MPPALTRFAATALLALAAAWGHTQAGDWGNIAVVSGTLGDHTNRLCVGVPDTMRPADIGCPTYSPYLTSGGLIGIGTTNPNANLDVYGTISATNFVGDGSGLTGVIAGATDRIISGTNAATRMMAISDTGYISIMQAGANSGWFDPYRGLVTLGVSATGPISGTAGYFSGKVGIGTRAPSAMLTLSEEDSDGDASLSFRSGSGTPGATREARITAVSTGGGGNGHSLAFFTNDTGAAPAERVRISAVGNVGIGTVTPSRNLQVDAPITGYVRVSGGPTGSPSRRAVVELASTDVHRALGVLTVPSGTEGWFFGQGYNMTAFTIGHGASQAEYLANSKLLIGTNGNVGIGVASTAPSTSLQVSGTLRIADGGEACDANRAGSVRYTSQSIFQVCKGIGWLALADEGSAAPGDRIVSGTTNAIAWQDRSLTISTAGSERMVVGENGRVGIGTSSPNTTLHVNGTVIGQRFAANNYLGSSYWLPGGTSSVLSSYNLLVLQTYQSGQDIVLLPNAGKVGIATPSPTATLQVSGSFIVSTSAQTTTPSLYIGANGKVGIGEVAAAYATGEEILFIARPQSGAGATEAARVQIKQMGSGRSAVANFVSGVAGGQNPYFALETRTASGAPDMAERLRVTAAGNVGISTMNPKAKLDVAGTISASDAIQLGQNTIACGVQVSGSIRYNIISDTVQFCNGTGWVSLASGTTGTGGGLEDRIVSGTTNAIAWQDRSLTITTGGSQRMIVGENGRVGIGTSFPNAPLEISDTVAKIKLNDTSGIFGGGLVLINSGVTNWTLGGGNDGVDQSSFGFLDASSNLVMNLKQGGSVGIGGVVTPTATLQVSGSFTISTSAQAATRPSLVVGVDGKVGMGTTQTAASTLTVMSDRQQLLLTTPDLRKQLVLEYSTASNTAAIGIEDGYSVADLVFRNNGAERMRLAANGRVGIATGNATPSTTLHVSGTIRIANSNESCDGNRAGSIRYTSSSIFQACKGTSWLALLDEGSGSASGDRIVSGTTNAIAWQDRSLTISTNGIERVVVGENGWIGVNMTTPQAPLHVSSSLGGMYLTRGGAVNEPYIVFQNGATGARQAQLRGVGDGGFRVTNGGATVSWLNILSTSEVGIGTSSPRATLQVSGTFTVSNSSQGSTSPSLVVAEDGNVGVGTAIPGNALHVAGNGLRLSGQYGRLIIEPSNFGTTETWNIDSSGGALRFFSEPYAISGIPGGGSVRMTIVSPTGFIGIGTGTPRARLDVVGTISASNAIQLGQSTIACATGVSGSIRYSTASNTVQFCNGMGWVSLASGTTSGMVTGIGSATAVAFWNGTSAISFSDGFYWDDANKRLGIGTNSPTLALDVRGPGHIGVSGSSAGLYFYDRSVGTGVSVLYRTGNKSYLYDNLRGNMVTLDNATGNFGIGLGGTIAPVATLQVSGTLTVSTSAQAATRPSLFVGEDGKVGVGTNNPQAQLDVTLRQDLGNLKALVLSNASTQWSSDPKSVSLVFTRTPSGNIETHDFGEIRGGVESGDAAQGYLSFWSGGGANRSEKMRLMHSGRVGIGTTAPSNTLDIATDPGANPLARLMSTNVSDGRAVLSFQTNYGSGQTYHVGIGAGGGTSRDWGVRDVTAAGAPTRLTIRADTGNIGINTPLPAATLQVSGTFTVSTSSQNSSPSLHVGTNGYVGIGTNSPVASLMIEGTTQTVGAFDTTGSKSGMIELRGGSAGAGAGGGILFGAFGDTFAAIRGKIADASGNGTGRLSFALRENTSVNTLTERMMIAENGYVGIGTTTPAARLDVVSSTASVAVIRAQNGTGTCTYTPASSGTGTWACSSDARLKQDISDTTHRGLDYVRDFRIRDFTMKSDGSRQTGVVAQEVITSHPGMVHKDEKGFYMVEEPSKWLMVKALQELKADNDNLRDEVEELRGELQALKQAVGH